MAHPEVPAERTVDREALVALAQRIKARQVRQTELWRRPMQPAHWSETQPAGERLPHNQTGLVRPAARGRDCPRRNGS
jgi:hypothetical protein